MPWYVALGQFFLPVFMTDIFIVSNRIISFNGIRRYWLGWRWFPSGPSMPTAKIPRASAQMEYIRMGTLSFVSMAAKAIPCEAAIKKWSTTMICGKRKWTMNKWFRYLADQNLHLKIACLFRYPGRSGIEFMLRFALSLTYYPFHVVQNSLSISRNHNSFL